MIAGQQETELDYYGSVGKADDIVNIKLLDSSLRPLRGNLFGRELRVQKADGTEIAFHDDDFEGTKDATIHDLHGVKIDTRIRTAAVARRSPTSIVGGNNPAAHDFNRWCLCGKKSCRGIHCTPQVE